MDTLTPYVARVKADRMAYSERHCHAEQPSLGLGWFGSWLHRLVIALFVIPVAMAVVPVMAQANAWEAVLPEAKPVGNGEFRYWGFRVYTATLWSAQGRYQPSEPFALSLTYMRDLSREDIVEASFDQMRELGYPVDNHPEWKQKLDQAMASVKSGDSLTGVYMPGQGAVFFHNDRLTGQIGEALAKAFFAIWLDPKTSQPALRQALLGGSP